LAQPQIQKSNQLLCRLILNNVTIADKQISALTPSLGRTRILVRQ